MSSPELVELAESIERALPPVYREKYEELIVAAGYQLCLQLQATSQTRFIQLFQALCTHITTRQAVAFTCQVFRRLGCELQTLQEQYPQCELDDPVIARISDIEEQIKNEIELNILTLDGQLEKFYVSMYRLVLYAVFHAKQRVTERKKFYELFCLLSEGLPLQLAVDITYFGLKWFNCYPAVALIEKYVTPNYCLEIDQPEVHLRLRVAEFFLSLSEQECKVAMLYLSRRYLNNRAIDNDTPIEFVQVLCETNTVTVDNLDNIKDIAKHYHRSHLFDGSSLGTEEQRKSCKYIHLVLLIYGLHCIDSNMKQFMTTKPVIIREGMTNYHIHCNLMCIFCYRGRDTLQ